MRLKANIVIVLATVAAACSDTSVPMSPSVSVPAAAQALVVKPRSRAIYIADLQLSSIYVSISSGFTPFTVTVTNPTSKDIGMIYLKGELQSQNNQPPLPASAFLAYCPNGN